MNTQPLTLQGLKGKVEPLEFWTFDCVNCIRTSPHMSQLHRTYAGDMFVLIGVHTPESEFEKDPENVAGVVRRLRIENPIAIEGPCIRSTVD